MNPENLQALENLISIWELKYLDESNDNVTRSLLSVVLYIAGEFVNQRAVLLPHASKMFCQAYGPESIDMNIQLKVSESTFLFTSKWLLNQLIVHFQDHMKYKCIHKKFGTILYRKGSDPLVSLSWALGRIHDNSPSGPPLTQPRNEDDHDRRLQVITEAAHINNHLHSEIAKMG